jgi:endogenous inhibitor of DNA gyrase (YacG/DUF329 family)
MAAKTKCPNCAKMFVPWRGKQFCSERCRKTVQNRRLRQSGTGVAGSQETQEISEQNQGLTEAMRRDGPAFVVRHAEWIAVNEITQKFLYKEPAIGWAMNIEGRGWFGRVGKDMSFGPTTLHRARLSVEQFIKGEPFAKNKPEQSWRGDCWDLVVAAPPDVSSRHTQP